MVKYLTKGKLPNRHLYCLMSKSLEDSYCRAEYALVVFGFICLNSETLQFVKFVGRKVLTAEKTYSCQQQY